MEARIMETPVMSTLNYRVAIHEAGHAVAALYYGFEPYERSVVTLRGNEEEASGTTGFRSKSGDRVHGAVISLAGAAAEWIYASDGKRPGSITIIGAEGDLAVAAQALGFAGADDLPEALIQLFVLQARRILQDEGRWRAVTEMARALMERGSLDRDEVVAIYRHAARAGGEPQGASAGH